MRAYVQCMHYMSTSIVFIVCVVYICSSGFFSFPPQSLATQFFALSVSRSHVNLFCQSDSCFVIILYEWSFLYLLILIQSFVDNKPPHVKIYNKRVTQLFSNFSCMKGIASDEINLTPFGFTWHLQNWSILHNVIVILSQMKRGW